MMNSIFGSAKKQKTPFYLKIIDSLSSMYRSFGVDYSQMRTILKMKMTVDSRRESALQGFESTKSQEKEKNHFFSSLWVYSLISIFLLFLFVYDNWVFQYTTYFSFIFIMIFSTMLANFSNILLDVKDSALIGTKPVTKKTMAAAKATHVAFYLISFTGAIGAPMILSTFYFNGIMAGILVLFLTLLASLWCLGLTIFMYATVLKKFDGERLKNIISYSQIAVSVFMIFGYYLMGQIFQLVDPETLLVEMNLEIGHALIFPMWFVAPFGLLQEGLQNVYLIYTLFLVLGTLGVGLLYYFNNSKIEDHLQKMNSTSTKDSKRTGLQRTAARLLCKDMLEAAYFHFTWQLTKNEREFKTRLYPSIASALVFPVVMLFSEMSTDPSVSAGTSVTSLYLPYFTFLVIPMLAVSMQFSTNYKGRWVYELTPKLSKASFLKAVSKVMMVKILLPLYSLVSLLVLVMTGFSSVVQLINGFLLMCVIFYLEVKRTNKALPFSRKFVASEANQGCMATLIFFVPVFVVSFLMILIQTVVSYAQWVVLIVLIGLNFWWMRNEKTVD